MERATDTDVTAAIAAQQLEDLARIEGGDPKKCISFSAIKKFVRRHLGKDEDPKLNGELDTADGRGYVKSHDIKPIVRK